MRTSFPTFPVPPDSPGLSSGAKVGIGLGVPIAVIFFAAVGFFGYRYYVRKQSRRAIPELPHDVAGTQEGPEKGQGSEVEEMALERPKRA